MKRAVKRLAGALGLQISRVQPRQDPEQWFIDNGSDRDARASILTRFRNIQDNVECAHSEREALMMADFLLASPLKGPMVECGCYEGGSTAKLSLLASASRRLLVCDSFQGLPEPSGHDRLHHWFDSGNPVPYQQGQYTGSLDEVKDNVRQFGALDHCDFIPGFFSDTLATLEADELSFIFLDVDYISSAPKLAMGSRLYTHEARSKEFIYGITDHSWWRETFNACPPLLIGAGYGCGPGAQDLAFMEKQ
jgi:O-methyltransferase